MWWDAPLGKTGAGVIVRNAEGQVGWGLPLAKNREEYRDPLLRQRLSRGMNLFCPRAAGEMQCDGRHGAFSCAERLSRNAFRDSQRAGEWGAAPGGHARGPGRSRTVSAATQGTLAWNVPDPRLGGRRKGVNERGDGAHRGYAERIRRRGRTGLETGAPVFCERVNNSFAVNELSEILVLEE